jgi:hypothetical protein
LFIEQAIKSALDQDVNFEYEIVVGEDCSTDATASILRKLQCQNHDRINAIYREENLGITSNFISTVAACKGEYVAFLEGDDYWTSRNKLQLQVNFLDNNPYATGVFHRTRSVNATNSSNEFVVPPTDPPGFASFDFLIQDGNPVATSSLVARRSRLTDINRWLADINPYDWLLSMMLAKQGPLGFIPLEMSHHRQHAGGDWTRLSPHQHVAIIVRVLRHASGLISGEAKDLVEQHLTRFANWLSGELVANNSASIEQVTKVMRERADIQVYDYLLSGVVAVARAQHQATQWHENQAKAWEAAAARASQDASEAANANEQLASANEQLINANGQLQSTTQELQAKIAELERNARRTGWLLDRLRDKIRHFPGDLTRRLRASLKKRRR